MTSVNPATIEVPTRSVDSLCPTQTQEISVCICTLKRGKLLERLLTALQNQRTEGRFTYSVVVTDNDSERSAEPVVTAVSAETHLAIAYCVETQRNIALARNKAIENASGNLIAFIDDDEFPDNNWLCNLFTTLDSTGADGVLGPVKPHFESEPPRWVTKGGFFDRPTHPTGYQVEWEEGRTGNVLFRKNILSTAEPPFRSQFDTAGEDVDFFRRMMGKGCSFVWCNEAVAYETVPASRCNRSYLLKRALLRGSNFHKHPTHRFRNIAKSILAMPAYALLLPVLLLFGEHVFLEYLIKLLDHASRLLSFAGLSVIKERPSAGG